MTARPVTMTTYRMADGSQVHGEYAWVVDAEYFEGTPDCEVIVEVWQRIDKRHQTFNPTPVDLEKA